MAALSALKNYMTQFEFSSDLRKILTNQGQAGSIQKRHIAIGRIDEE